MCDVTQVRRRKKCGVLVTFIGRYRPREGYREWTMNRRSPVQITWPLAGVYGGQSKRGGTSNRVVIFYNCALAVEGNWANLRLCLPPSPGPLKQPSISTHGSMSFVSVTLHEERRSPARAHSPEQYAAFRALTTQYRYPSSLNR